MKFALLKSTISKKKKKKVRLWVGVIKFIINHFMFEE